VPWQATGKFILVPGKYKVRYELETKVGGARGLFKVICDGDTVYRVMENAGQHAVQHYKLQTLLESRKAFDPLQIDKEKVAAFERDDDGDHGFLGILPILRDLQANMRFQKMETTVLPGDRPVYLLEGEWTKAYLDKLAPERKPPEGRAGQPAPPNPAELWAKRQPPFVLVPRSCKVYLRRDSLWPVRIDWYGPEKAEGPDVLLSRVEYTEPVVTPRPEAEAAALFAPSPEEKNISESIDPSVLVKARLETLARQQRLEEEAAKRRSLQDSTLSPSSSPSK
jgi:hypothetical protein